jgi:flagellar biosynthetic protein FliR
MNFDSVTLEFLQQKFIIGVLFFVRISAMISTAPILNNRGIPNQIKVFLAIFLAVFMTTTFADSQPPIAFHIYALVPIVLKELLVGVLISYCMNLLFNAVRFAGGIADVDIGFQTSLVFNVDAGAPTLLGDFKYIILTMVFLILNGHHFLIESIYASIKLIPLTKFAIGEATIELLVMLVTSMFIIGIKIAAPVLIALFLTNLSLALLSRVAPQLNIFVLSFQFKIVVGLTVLFVVSPIIVYVTKNALSVFERDTMKVLESIRLAM